MDTDLERMSREQLMEEVMKLRKAFVSIVTVRAMSSAGIIQRCGDCCRRRPTRFLWCRTGRSSCKAACGIASRLTKNCLTLRERRSPTRSESLEGQAAAGASHSCRELGTLEEAPSLDVLAGDVGRLGMCA
jgi:hypothetical protein